MRRILGTCCEIVGGNWTGFCFVTWSDGTRESMTEQELRHLLGFDRGVRAVINVGWYPCKRLSDGAIVEDIRTGKKSV